VFSGLIFTCRSRGAKVVIFGMQETGQSDAFKRKLEIERLFQISI